MGNVVWGWRRWLDNLLGDYFHLDVLHMDQEMRTGNGKEVWGWKRWLDNRLKFYNKLT